MDDQTTCPDFRALFEAAPNLYLVLSPDLVIVAVSVPIAAPKDRARRIPGRRLFDIFPDNLDDPAATGVNLRLAGARAAVPPPDAMRCEIRHPPAGSEGGGFEVRFWAPLNAPVLNQAGEVTSIIHRVEDVTEMVRLQEKADARIEHVRNQQDVIDQLQKTTSFLDAVIENLPGMLFVKSFPDSRFVLFNRAGEELLGYGRKEYLGKSDYDFFPKDQADHFVAKDRAVLDSGAIQVTPEEPINTREKGPRLLRTIKVPVKDKAGKAEYLLGYSEDITERKAIEQQLRQAVKMEAVGQLTGGVAHDFNNLLGIIIGNLDIAAEQAASDPALREIIQEALKRRPARRAELTPAALAFSRAAAPLQPAVIDLNQGLPQIAGMLRRTLGEQVTVELHPDPLTYGRSRSIPRSWTSDYHLTSRSTRAMPCPKGGTVSIETHNVRLDRDYAAANPEATPGEYIQLAVSDPARHEREVIEHCFRAVLHHQGIERGPASTSARSTASSSSPGGHIKIYSEGRPRHLGEGLSAAQQWGRHRPMADTAGHAPALGTRAGADGGGQRGSAHRHAEAAHRPRLSHAGGGQRQGGARDPGGAPGHRPPVHRHRDARRHDRHRAGARGQAALSGSRSCSPPATPRARWPTASRYRRPGAAEQAVPEARPRARLRSVLERK
jgi:PAS domain S-box-containing protein